MVFDKLLFDVMLISFDLGSHDARRIENVSTSGGNGWMPIAAEDVTGVQASTTHDNHSPTSTEPFPITNLTWHMCGMAPV